MNSLITKWNSYCHKKTTKSQWVLVLVIAAWLVLSSYFFLYGYFTYQKVDQLRASPGITIDENTDIDLFIVSLNNKATDDDLAQLEKLPRIGFLYLDSPLVTEAGLSRIRGHTKLRALALRNNKIITSKTFLHLDSLPQLKFLEICNATIKGNALKPLKNAVALEQIIFSECRFEEPHSLLFLKDITTLRDVRLFNSPITKVMIGDFANFSQLDKLHIDMPDSMTNEIATLKQVLPYTEISWSPSWSR